MEDYQKLYTTMFNAFTDALRELEKQNYGSAKDICTPSWRPRGCLSRKEKEGTWGKRNEFFLTGEECVV